MKKILAFVLVCALLLTGTALPASADTAVKAASMDELLAAIRPGAVIELEGKDYTLTDAVSYPAENGEYWQWVDCYDGYELQIENVDGLTIRGSEDTRLLTSPRYANVLTFRNCRNITLEDMEVGHTPEQGSCSGGVVLLDNCSNVTLNDCLLYGCGVTGLTALDCDTVTVRNTVINDCSFSGAEIYRSGDVFFDACTFSSNGGEDYTGSALYLDSSRYVTVMNCGFYGNLLSYLLTATGSADVSLLGCESIGNEYAFFWLEATDVTVMNCSFEDLRAGNAFAAADNPGRVLDGNGNEIPFDALLLMKLVPAAERPARAQAPAAAPVQGGTNLHYYEVSSADEFLAAIGSHRVICLTRDIDLSTASDYGTGWTESRRWEEVYDGWQLVITGIRDMTVTARQPGVSLVTSPREANVLTFSACRDITVSGLTVGHTEMPGYSCTGAVLTFNGCRDTEIEDCALFGCGTIGVEASSCTELDIEDTEIYDCTIGGIYFYDVDEAELENCSIHDCAYPALYIGDSCRDIEIDGRPYAPGEYDRF